jgi:hypothetical protein
LPTSSLKKSVLILKPVLLSSIPLKNFLFVMSQNLP